MQSQRATVTSPKHISRRRSRVLVWVPWLGIPYTQSQLGAADRLVNFCWIQFNCPNQFRRTDLPVKRWNKSVTMSDLTMQVVWGFVDSVYRLWIQCRTCHFWRIRSMEDQWRILLYRYIQQERRLPPGCSMPHEAGKSVVQSPPFVPNAGSLGENINNGYTRHCERCAKLTNQMLETSQQLHSSSAGKPRSSSVLLLWKMALQPERSSSLEKPSYCLDASMFFWSFRSILTSEEFAKSLLWLTKWAAFALALAILTPKNDIRPELWLLVRAFQIL